MQFEYQSSAFCATEETYSTDFSKRECGETRLSHVCSVLEDRRLQPSLAMKNIEIRVSVLYTSRYQRAVFQLHGCL